MSPRVRLVKVTVVPEFVTDDGEHLTPLPAVQPMEIPAARWQEFVTTGLATAVAGLQAQIDADSDDTANAK